MSGGAGCSVPQDCAAGGGLLSVSAAVVCRITHRNEQASDVLVVQRWVAVFWSFRKDLKRLQAF